MYSTSANNLVGLWSLEHLSTIAILRTISLTTCQGIKNQINPSVSKSLQNEGYTVCPSILLHFQLAFWGSSGWMSTKSFYHDKVDIWQILLHFKIFFSQPLISVCPSEKNIRFSLNHGVWKMSKMKDCLRTLWTCSLLQKFLWNRIGHI